MDVKGRIEVLMKIQKKIFWGEGWGVRVDVNKELKFFVKIQKKKIFLGGGRGVSRGGGG